MSETSGRFNYTIMFVLVVALSLATRVYLALAGGQFYFGDEFRFHDVENAAQMVLSGEIQKAIGKSTLSIEHIGYKVIGIVLEVCRIALGLNKSFTYVAFALFSLSNIILVWRIARNYGAPRQESFLAAAFMACSGSMLIFSRHLVPYDLSLALWLAGLALVAGENTSPVRLAAAGFLSMFSFITYNGYWLLLPVLCIMVALHCAWSFRAAITGLFSMTIGGSLAFSTLFLTGRSITEIVQEYRSFSKTITMGDYQDGWLFPLEYLWQTDGLLFGIQLCCVIVMAWWVFFGKDKGRGRTYLTGSAAIYLMLGASSSILHSFVVYGRTARQLVPLLCLISGRVLCGVLFSSSTRTCVVASLCTILFCVGGMNYFGPITMIFKDKFERELDSRYKKYRTTPGFEILDADESPVSLDCSNTVCIARSPSPKDYAPYRYEGVSRKEREFMASQRHEFLFVKKRHDIPRLNIDFISEEIPSDVYHAGVGELMDYKGKEMRWAIGQTATVEFWEHGGKAVQVAYELENFLVPEQEVKFYANEKLIEAFTLVREENRKISHSRSFNISPVDGLNVIRFEFSDWNGKTKLFIDKDPRPFAAAFSKLSIKTAEAVE